MYASETQASKYLFTVNTLRVSHVLVILVICGDKSQQKVPYCRVALSTGPLNKLSNDTKFVKIELLLLKIYKEKDGIFFLLLSLSLYLTSYFGQYLKISLVDVN